MEPIECEVILRTKITRPGEYVLQTIYLLQKKQRPKVEIYRQVLAKVKVNEVPSDNEVRIGYELKTNKFHVGTDGVELIEGLAQTITKSFSKKELQNERRETKRRERNHKVGKKARRRISESAERNEQ